MAKSKQKDFWDKAQVLAPFFLGLVGLFFTFVLQRQQEQNRNSQQKIEQMIQNRQSEREFRVQMFPIFYENLQNPRLPIEEKLSFLKLFKASFPNEVADFGTYFYQKLAQGADDLSSKQKDVILRELILMAQEVVKNQELFVNGESNIIRLEENSDSVRNFTSSLGKWGRTP
jgi:hypothetical protein